MKHVVMMILFLVSLFFVPESVCAQEPTQTQTQDIQQSGESSGNDVDGSGVFAHPVVNGDGHGSSYAPLSYFWNWMSDHYMPIPDFNITFINLFEYVAVAYILLRFLISFIQSVSGGNRD